MCDVPTNSTFEVEWATNAGSHDTEMMLSLAVSDDVTLVFPPGEWCPAPTNKLHPPMGNFVKAKANYDPDVPKNHSEYFELLMASAPTVFHEKSDNCKGSAKESKKAVAEASVVFPSE